MPRGRKAAVPTPAPTAPALTIDPAESLSSVIGTLSSLGLVVDSTEVELSTGSKTETRIIIKARGGAYAPATEEPQPEASEAPAEAPVESEE